MKFKKLSIIVWVAVFLFACSSSGAIKNPYTQEYTPGEGNIQGDVDVDFFESADSRFAIGADEEPHLWTFMKIVLNDIITEC